MEDQDDEEEGRKLESGLLQLLLGTEQFFPIIIADRGYDKIPKNVKKDNICKFIPLSLGNRADHFSPATVVLRDLYKEKHVPFLTPGTMDSKFIFQWR